MEKGEKGPSYLTEADYTKFWGSTLDQFKGKNGKIEGQNRKSAVWVLAQARSETQTIDTWSDRITAAGEHFGLSEEEIDTIILRLAPSLFPEEYQRIKAAEEPAPVPAPAGPALPFASELDSNLRGSGAVARPLLDTIPRGRFSPARPNSTSR
jgi:hypothetical protein